MRSLPRKPIRPLARRGLAPLEFVLSLPILLFTMALMISFGTAAAWKVRGLEAARQGIWRDRVWWNGGSDPRPDNWPSSAQMGSTSASDMTRTPQYWDIGPITHPITRGPVIAGQGHTGQSGYITVRDRRYFEMDEGVRQGTSSIERTYALLPRSGKFEYALRHQLLDSRWQFHSQGFSSNGSRRARGWYNFESAPEWAAQQARFQAADQQLVANPRGRDLVPLDRDEELHAFYGSYREFHPLIGACRPNRPNCGAGCELDPSVVRLNVVLPLVDRIQGPRGGGRGGVPDNMASAWISMYQSMIQQLQQQQPPPQAQIDQLQQLVDQLTQFQATLN